MIRESWVQRRCPKCDGIHLGDSAVCRTCRVKYPDYVPPEIQDLDLGTMPEMKSAITVPQNIERGRLISGDSPFPKGRVHIPQTEDRDYRASIVITTPDITGENFQYCISLLRKHTPGEHRIVVVETHYNEKPYNYARDINIGLRGALDSDYYVMLNDDVFVEEAWLDKLVACARQRENIGIVGALLFFPGKKIVQHAGGSYDASVKNWANIGQMPVGHNYSNIPTRRCKREIYKEKYMTWNTGALLLITDACIETIGLMDEKLVAHCDDVEYSFRAWLNGFTVVYCPSVEAVHRENVTRKIGTKDAPDYVYKATRHLMLVLPKDKADEVQKMVDEYNEWDYP